jgi:site-specific DNA-methyltransferase (adenine-specific)
MRPLSTKPGDVVLDPFAGSGTSLIAAELKDRRWTGIEIVELDPILSRLSDLGPERENLERIGESKNRLFTARAEELRRQHHHAWGDK